MGGKWKNKTKQKNNNNNNDKQRILGAGCNLETPGALGAFGSQSGQRAPQARSGSKQIAI